MTNLRKKKKIYANLPNLLDHLELFLVDCEPLEENLDDTVYMQGWNNALYLVNSELQRLKKLL